MEEKKKNAYCENCADTEEYMLKKEPFEKIIRDKTYDFMITKAFCRKCGNEVFPNFIFDLNVKEVDEQYRKFEKIITLKEIEALMSIYNIGKTPLSLTLGFGEITINRYFNGQVPSKEYSDIMYKALYNLDFMSDCLKKNHLKIGETAYKKAINAIQNQKTMLSSVSEKLLMVIAYIFSFNTDVTPLALQKLLYYIQSIYKYLHNIDLFNEPCEAWVHGPVYRSVYNMFRDFKYNPIEDNRFYLIKCLITDLSDDEKNVIYLVMNSFGLYSGKVLESITHEELPWRIAREGYMPDELSSKEIDRTDIDSYFKSVGEKYSLNSVEGIKKYIADMLNDANK